MRFSYKVLHRVVAEEIIPHHDGVIEGGIGVNVGRYKYFRDLGYDKLYIGIDLAKHDVKIPDGLIYINGDCFSSNFLASVFAEYGIKNPVFLTNGGGLTESMLSTVVINNYYSSHIDEAAEALTRSFRKQLHIRPTTKFPITDFRINYPEITENQEYNQVMQFLYECRKRGWREDVVGRNIVLLRR